MSASLVPCPGCQRHVRLPVSSCPFCGTSTAQMLPPVLPTGRRMRRAAIAVISASVALSACGTSTGNPDGSTGADASVQDSGMNDEETSISVRYGLPADR